jgi:2-amino-4-hydroxy-6-hydroxymethyldihydropteridine diphosphokinase
VSALATPLLALECAPVEVFIALGANLGGLTQALEAAMAAIDGLPHTRITRRSSLYRSAPVDATGPDYVNAVVAVSTVLIAPELLEQLQKIEQTAGRVRTTRNAPRTLDLDILLYGSACIDSPTLTVPHPRMTQRAFVLLPLAEIAPEWAGMASSPAITAQRIERLILMG